MLQEQGDPPETSTWEAQLLWLLPFSASYSSTTINQKCIFNNIHTFRNSQRRKGFMSKLLAWDSGQVNSGFAGLGHFPWML